MFAAFVSAAVAGFVIGYFFRATAIVAATIIVFVGLIGSAFAAGWSIGIAILSVFGCLTGIQCGYVLGACARWHLQSGLKAK